MTLNKQTYIIIDTANLFFRARHSIQGDLDTQLGMAFHIVLNSIKKAWQDFKGTHVVVCLEGRSWRKDHYAPYKKNRSDARSAHTPKEAEEEKVFWEAFDTFKEFIQTKTNCTVLQHPQLEADDLIAGWIQNHKTSDHVIISTDTDFMQLIASNVKQYNGITEVTVTTEGYFDKKGKPVIDSKTSQVKAPPDPEWLLFEKCIRGDTSDNVFSAFPGVRKKSTKNKVGLLEAFADRNSKGFNWNHLMLQKWTDHNGAEHRVKDDYERNRQLIDLTAQPESIKAIINESIATTIQEDKSISQVGLKLMKFCGIYDLNKISEQAQSYSIPLNAKYNNQESTS